MPAQPDDRHGVSASLQPSLAREAWFAMGQQAVRAVLVGLFLGLALALIGGFSVLSGRTTYTSTAVMLINDPYKLATSGQLNEFGSLDILRYKYSALVGTTAIAEPVATQVGLPVGEVIGALSTNVPANSLLMSVTATWSTPAEAQKLAQATADEITAYIDQEDNTYSIPTKDRFTFEAIDRASPASAHGPSKARAASLAIGLGLLGFAIGFVGTQLLRFLRTH